MHGELYPVICGPTAGGKTALAIELARRAGGEVVSADSIQIYRGLDIGSGKATLEERRGVAHHLIDIADPRERFSVHDWLARCEACVSEVRRRGKLPIVVGGTHLYIRAFLEGLFEGPAVDEGLREEIRALGQEERRRELERVDPRAASRIHPRDERRTVRALEVFRQTGRPISEHQTQWGRDESGRAAPRPGCVLVGLDWPAPAINPRINARVRSMIDRGLVEEARALHEGGLLGEQAREALGYKQLLDHFAGACPLGACVEKIKIETRRFAKNQRTWMKRLRTTAGAVWIHAAETPEAQWTEVVLRALGR